MTTWPKVMAANGRQATALHSGALRGLRLTSNTPLTRFTFAPMTLAMQAAQTPIAEAGDAQMYLRAVVDMVGLVETTALLEKGIRLRDC